MMFHEQLSDYFDFLNMPGYKTMQCYRFLDESMELRSIHDYYINHFGKLIKQAEVGDPKVISDSWYRYSKKDVSPNDKYKYILSGFEKWVDWEKETKEKYSTWYGELISNREYATADIILDVLRNVDEELALASMMYIEINDLGGNMDAIISKQESLVEEYSEKCKKMF